MKGFDGSKSFSKILKVLKFEKFSQNAGILSSFEIFNGVHKRPILDQFSDWATYLRKIPRMRLRNYAIHKVPGNWSASVYNNSQDNVVGYNSRIMLIDNVDYHWEWHGWKNISGLKITLILQSRRIVSKYIKRSSFF